MSHQESLRIKASVLLLPDVVMEYETLSTGSWRCVRKERVTLPFPRSTSTPNPLTTVVSVQIPVRINRRKKESRVSPRLPVAPFHLCTTDSMRLGQGFGETLRERPCEPRACSPVSCFMLYVSSWSLQNRLWDKGPSPFRRCQMYGKNWSASSYSCLQFRNWTTC